MIPDSPIFTVPFPRSYWVVPGQLLAGCYPGSLDNKEADRKLRGLLNHGIRHVINLMEPDEFNWDREPFKPYEGQMAAVADSMGLDVTFESSPIRDGGVSDHGDMVAILESIDANIKKGRPVYIHCPALLNGLRKIRCTTRTFCRVIRPGGFYTGFTQDLKPRFEQHQNERIRMAKYLKTYHRNMFLRKRLKSYFTGPALLNA